VKSGSSLALDETAKENKMANAQNSLFIDLRPLFLSKVWGETAIGTG
jgi:hypothetical protein